jgi:homoserine dehydrogenase
MSMARVVTGCARATPDPHLLARLLATGEDAAVALVALAVRGNGGTVLAQTSSDLALRTEGEPLDAEPVAWDGPAVRAGFDRGEAVVVPGFVGRDRSGRPTLLGRGGSDLTALFLATRLDADECRLLKDVDGLYTGDPRESPDVRRYVTATWRRALAVGNQVVQPKAVRFAERHGIEFSLGALQTRGGTRVGRGPDNLAVEDEYLAESVSG